MHAYGLKNLSMVFFFLVIGIFMLGCDEDPSTSAPPVIDSIVAYDGATPIKVKPNQSISLTANITDDDGIKKYLWEVTGDCGNIDDSNDQTTSFYANSTTGICTISLTVIDWSGNQVSKTADIEITEFAAMTDPITDFKVTPTTGEIELSWTNPDSTFFKEAVLCYSETDYYSSPDECGQYLVYQGSQQNYVHQSLIDSNPLEDGQVYYYSLFTLDKMDNSLEALTTSSSTIPKASSFTATSVTATSIDLNWAVPIYSNIVGVKIVRSTSSYPQTPEEGTTVYENTGTNTTDSGLTTHQAYYYSLFVMDAEDNYSDSLTAKEGPKFDFEVISTSDGLPSDCVQDIFVSKASQNLYIGFQNGAGPALLITTDRTADPLSFNQIDTPNIPSRNVQSLYESTSNGYLYVGCSEGLAMTQQKDGLGTWHQYDSSTSGFCSTNDSIVSITYTDGTSYIGIETVNMDEGGVSYTPDDGTTWYTLTTSDGLPSNNITNVAGMNGNLFVGTFSDDLVMTSDDGNNWTPYEIVNVVSSDQIRALFCDSNNNDIFVGTNSGLAISTDGGSSWIGSDDFMSTGNQNVGVYDIDVVDGDIYMATAQGALVSVDGGENWVGYTTEDGMPSTQLSSIAVDPNNGTIYIGTYDAGFVIASAP